MATVMLKSATGEEIEFEISRSGKLACRDERVIEAIEYDKSMMEFGEPPSMLIEFIEIWKTNMFVGTFIYLLNEDSVKLFAFDCVEHILTAPIVDTLDISGMQLGIVVDAVRKTRKTVTNPARITTKQEDAVEAFNEILDDIINKPKSLVESVSFVNKTRREYTETQKKKFCSAMFFAEAAFAAHSAILSATEGSTYRRAGGIEIFGDRTKYYNSIKHDAVEACRRAQLAMAYATAPGDEFPGWNTAKRREFRWQIARIVDVLNSIQANKPWPPLGATK